MADHKRLFGSSGIRGIPGEDLTLGFVTEISQAIGTFFKKGSILVGYDGRKSSPAFSKTVASGLMSVGLNVGEAGLLPTPALQFNVKKMGYNGGVMITASHNPANYNGIKVSGEDGVDLTREEEIIIGNIYHTKKFYHADWKTAGTSFQETKAIKNYIDAILSHVDVKLIRSKDFKVVMDTGNGAQGVAAPYLLKELNCKQVTLNAHVDGDFPGRGAEPTPNVLQALSGTVTSNNADLGVAYDGDGDRCLFCDEKGVVYWGDRSGALLVDYILSNHPGALIVTAINSSKVIDDMVAKHNGKIFKTRVGSVDVSNTMLERGAIFGLEENGGCFYAPHIPVRDGAMTTALMLEALAKSGEPLSDMLKKLPWYHQKKTKFECPRNLVPEVMKKLDAHAKGKKVDRTDGLKIWLDENTWVILRPSGTEPVIRVFAESDKQKKLNAVIDEYSRLVKEAIDSHD